MLPGVYVDKRCVYFKRPLLESGTNGMDCHFQPIIPDLTESYNSRPMPSEKQIPVCTLKYFPTTIHHTIQVIFHLVLFSYVFSPLLYVDDDELMINCDNNGDENTSTVK